MLSVYPIVQRPRCRPIVFVLALLSSPPTLAEDFEFNAAQQRALHTAPQLQQRQATLTGARAAVQAADALPDPKLSVGLDNVPVTGAERFSLTQDGMTMYKLGIMQDIPNRGKRQARQEAAYARIQQEAANLQLSSTTIASATADAWLEYYYLQQQLSIVDELTQDNQLWQTVIPSQLAAGRITAAEALLPQQEALTLAARRDDLRRDQQRAYAALQRWLGLSDITLVGEPPVFQVDAAQLRQHVQHHPALMLLQPLADTRRAELHEAEAAKQSDWSVELAWQQREPNYSNMVSVQVSASLPLFSASRQTPLIREKQYALRAVEAEREDLFREHLAALEADLADYEALTRQRERLQQQALPLAQHKETLLQASYQQGRADLLAVLAARRERRELHLQHLSLIASQQRLAARLHYLYPTTIPTAEVTTP